MFLLMEVGARPIRVCHVIHDLRRGGAEHVLVDLAGVAAVAGLEMTVVSLMPLGNLAYPDELRSRGVRVESLDLATRWDPRGARRLSRLLRSLEADIAHSHLKHADVVTAAAAHRLQIPMVSTLHLIEDGVRGLARLKRRLGTRARRRGAARTIAVSDAVRRWYLEGQDVDPDTVVTIRNGVATPASGAGEREAVREELGIRPEAVVAVSVSLMRPGKGHDVLLDAASLLPEQSGVVVLMVGDGPLRPRIARRAAALPPGRVVFSGFRRDVGRILGAADLVVHPSQADALPTALIHGLAAALPIVASNVGGVPEIVGAEAGILVPPRDHAALAAAMLDLAGDPDRRRWMGKRARERFDQMFEAGVWARALHSLYREVLGGSE